MKWKWHVTWKLCQCIHEWHGMKDTWHVTCLAALAAWPHLRLLKECGGNTHQWQLNHGAARSSDRIHFWFKKRNHVPWDTFLQTQAARWLIQYRHCQSAWCESISIFMFPDPLKYIRIYHCSPTTITKTQQSAVVPEDFKTQSPDQTSGCHDRDAGIVLTMPKHLVIQIHRQDTMALSSQCPCTSLSKVANQRNSFFQMPQALKNLTTEFSATWSHHTESPSCLASTTPSTSRMSNYMWAYPAEV